MVSTILKWISLAIATLIAFVLLTNVGIHLVTESRIYDDVAAVPQAGAVLVPGAAVYNDGELSPIFLDRVTIALTLYEMGKVEKILVSGDNSSVEYNEVNPVRLYLLKAGVPDSDIFLDHAGFDTYSSMYRARDVFEVESVLIATQSFHLPRAVFIAEALGLEAYGVNADSGTILPRNYWRELLATQKALLDLVFLREPKYLGDPMPITEDATTVQEK